MKAPVLSLIENAHIQKSSKPRSKIKSDLDYDEHMCTMYICTSHDTLKRCKAQGRVAETRLEAQEEEKEEKEEEEDAKVESGIHAAKPRH